MLTIAVKGAPLNCFRIFTEIKFNFLLIMSNHQFPPYNQSRNLGRYRYGQLEGKRLKIQIGLRHEECPRGA